MSGQSRLNLRRSVVVAGALVLLLAGALTSYLLMRARTGSANNRMTMQSADATASASPSQPPASAATTNAPLPDVVVPLTNEAADRAGIVVTPVSTGAVTTSARLPGVVEPNAYRQVMVTSLVAGRITRVSVQLGDRVRRGQPLAQVYSPELAEAQTRYIAARAMLEAHERELHRTEKLVEIGAASRQELERIHAEHASQTAEVESTRSRLQLLGVPASALDSASPDPDMRATTTVPAPIDGVVTERLANPGLNVDPAVKLFTVVDLSTVWVVADLYEKDFSRVRVGTPATITTTAYPDVALQGRVSYIDPQVNPETRTAKVRVEVPNPRNELRFGMFADVSVEGTATDRTAVTIPRTAVQNVGDRQVVYLVNPKEPGRFVEREVRLGQPSGDDVEVLAGLNAGDVVVAEGSFFLRAERERLGLRPSTAAAETAGTSPRAGPADSAPQTANIVVTESGFEPAQVTVQAGRAARLTFVRTTEKTCATEVVFPSLNVKRVLPLNERVQIDLNPAKTETLAFSCGMNMLRGTVVVQ